MLFNSKKAKLGTTDKQLVIRMLKRRVNYYDIVVARRRARPNSRLCRLGYYEIKNNRREGTSVLSVDFNRVFNLLSTGVTLDNSFAKLVLN